MITADIKMQEANTKDVKIHKPQKKTDYQE